MRSRAQVLVVASVLLTGLSGGAVALPGATATAAAPQDWCSSPGATAPCIESATLDDNTGAGPQPVDSTSTTWQLTATDSSAGGSSSVTLSVEKVGAPDPYDLGAAADDDTWDVTLDMGATVPRVVFLKGDHLSVTRTDDGDGTWHVRVVGSPTHFTSADPTSGTGGCKQSSWPWTCPDTATADRHGLQAEVTDYGAWTDATERAAFFGMNYSTNIEATDMPPQIAPDPTTGTDQVVVDLANPHFYADGTTVFKGFVHLRIPNAFLKAVYGVDDPASMTTAGLTADYTGADTSAGTTSIAQEAGDDAMLVDATGLTFSAKKLHVRLGTVTPTRPTDIRARRTATHRAKVAFTRSRKRGSTIRGYTARCIAVTGSSVEHGTARRSPVVVKGLTRGVAYRCQVRARSKAGPSHWSVKDRIARHA